MTTCTSDLCLRRKTKVNLVQSSTKVTKSWWPEWAISWNSPHISQCMRSKGDEEIYYEKQNFGKGKDVTRTFLWSLETILFNFSLILASLWSEKYPNRGYQMWSTLLTVITDLDIDESVLVFVASRQ